METQRQGTLILVVHLFFKYIYIYNKILPPAYNLYHIINISKVIDYTSVRGGVSVLTNKAEITTSYLIIQRAQIDDGGIYSCQNGVVDPAKVKVHVLTGNQFVNDASLNLALCISLLHSYLLFNY